LFTRAQKEEVVAVNHVTTYTTVERQVVAQQTITKEGMTITGPVVITLLEKTTTTTDGRMTTNSSQTSTMRAPIISGMASLAGAAANPASMFAMAKDAFGGGGGGVMDTLMEWGPLAGIAGVLGLKKPKPAMPPMLDPVARPRRRDEE
jgi:hypothetical protein